MKRSQKNACGRYGKSNTTWRGISARRQLNVYFILFIGACEYTHTLTYTYALTHTHKHTALAGLDNKLVYPRFVVYNPWFLGEYQFWILPDWKNEKKLCMHLVSHETCSNTYFDLDTFYNDLNGFKL